LAFVFWLLLPPVAVLLVSTICHHHIIRFIFSDHDICNSEHDSWWNQVH
jgi:hypothetical protein